MDVKEFRPISLNDIVYKILAGFLANWLKSVLGKLCSHSQKAFIEGRQILHQVLVGLVLFFLMFTS